MNTNELYIQPFAGVKASELCMPPANLATSVSVCTIGCDREEPAAFPSKVLTPSGEELCFTVERDGTIRLVEEPKSDVGYGELCDILEGVS